MVANPAITAATKPIVSKGLFNSAAAGGMSFEQWKGKAGVSGAPMPTIAPAQINDSVADHVNDLTNQNSTLMQQAKTDGLRTAARRGLGNSSIAAGAAQDAALKYATPIASQDASQAFEKNQAARGFEYNMATQDDAQDFQAGESELTRKWQSGENVLDRTLQRDLETGRQKFQAGENKLDRTQRADLQTDQQKFTAGENVKDRAQDLTLQGNQIKSTEKLALADIESREGIAAAQRSLETRMQERGISADKATQIRDIASREGMAKAERELQRSLSLADIASREGLAAAENELTERMQENSLSAADRQQLRDIASREGMASAERSFQTKMKDIDQKFTAAQAKLDRNLQSQLATWNLKGSERLNATNMLVSYDQLYQNSITNINANTALSAKDRAAQISAAQNLRDRNFDLVQQMYQVKLDWGQKTTSSGTKSATSGSKPASTAFPAPPPPPPKKYPAPPPPPPRSVGSR